MIPSTTTRDLKGHFLIAMPTMADPRFENAVICISSCNDKGVIGLVINKPIQQMKLGTLFDQLDIEVEETYPHTLDMGVYSGGPMQSGRGFIIHSPDYKVRGNTVRLNNHLRMTSAKTILEDISVNRGPRSYFVALGYSGWDFGQLEKEILANAWLTTRARADVIFECPDHLKWQAALRTMGVEASALSHHFGQA